VVDTVTVNDLQPGDVLYYRSLHPSPLEDRIARQSGSPYTHAAVYLGNGNVLHAVADGVLVEPVSTLQDGRIGVFRNQSPNGLSAGQVRELNDFANALVATGAEYDLERAGTFFKEREKFLGSQLEFMIENYGRVTLPAEFAKGPYVCSGIVVAFFTIIGVITPTAQAAYPRKYFAPADLHRDGTFGWFLGYMLPPGDAVDEGDPLQYETSWRKNV
jgi:hypothetical protein